MEYIKGKFKKLIFESSGGSGYKVGLFRVKEASENLNEELVNHTITFTGYFYDLVLEENYIIHSKIGALVARELYNINDFYKETLNHKEVLNKYNHSRKVIFKRKNKNKCN